MRRLSKRSQNLISNLGNAPGILDIQQPGRDERRERDICERELLIKDPCNKGEDQVLCSSGRDGVSERERQRRRDTGVMKDSVVGRVKKVLCLILDNNGNI